MVRLTRRMTKAFLDDYNIYQKTMTIKSNGEQIDVNIGLKSLYVLENDADRLGTGDILAYGERGRWQITGLYQIAYGFAFFTIQRIEKWRGTPSWSGRGNNHDRSIHGATRKKLS
jgi:hypothetical protein